jgi:hypothetical protein
MDTLIEDGTQHMEESEEDMIDDLNNYKGVFHNEEEPEERYYEHGAHFPYQILCRKLEDLMIKLSPERRGFEIGTGPNNLVGIFLFIKNKIIGNHRT